MKNILCLIIILCFSGISYAGSSQSRALVTPLLEDGSINLIDDGACTDSEANRTITKQIRDFSRLVVALQITDANDSVTAATIDCRCSIDRGLTYNRIPSVAISSGTGTLSSFEYSWDPSGDTLKNISPFYDIWGCHYIQCIFDFTGDGAGDTFDVQMTVAADK